MEKRQNSYKFPVRDCNPGLEFSIPGFGIVELLEFPIPGSRRDCVLVQATKIATWVTVFAIFELQVCTIVLWI